MDDLTQVEIPHIPASEVQVQDEFKRVKDELAKMRTDLEVAEDPLLAERIRLENSLGGQSVEVDYHPDGLTELSDWADGQSPAYETHLKFRYTDRHYPSRVGLRRYLIDPSGQISVTQFQGSGSEKKGYAWSQPKAALAEDLNTALNGLVDQHSKLIDSRSKSSVVGLKVPSLL